MTDETEEDLEFEVDTDQGGAEYVEVEDAVIVAVRGWNDVAEHFGAPLARVRMPKGGSVEVLVMVGERWQWQDVTKLGGNAPGLIVLKGGKA